MRVLVAMLAVPAPGAPAPQAEAAGQLLNALLGVDVLAAGADFRAASGMAALRALTALRARLPRGARLHATLQCLSVASSSVHWPARGGVTGGTTSPAVVCRTSDRRSGACSLAGRAPLVGWQPSVQAAVCACVTLVWELWPSAWLTVLRGRQGAQAAVGLLAALVSGGPDCDVDAMTDFANAAVAAGLLGPLLQLTRSAQDSSAETVRFLICFTLCVK